MSVISSLKAMSLNRPIYHVHRLSEEGKELVRYRDLNQRKVLPGRPYWSSLYLSQQLAKNQDDLNWDFITLVRDPVARNISAFFQTLDIYCPEVKDNKYKTETDYFSILKQVFIDQFPHDHPLTWFDKEMKAVLGIDVFSTDFPLEKGFNFYQNVRRRLLLIRLENLTSCYFEALSSYLSIDREKVVLIDANLSSQKAYRNSYRNFIEWLSLPEEYLDQIYASRYARHFYSQADLDNFKSRWI